MTVCRPVQIESIHRRQSRCNLKTDILFGMGRDHNVFKRLVFQVGKKSGLCDKALNNKILDWTLLKACAYNKLSVALVMIFG